MAAGDAVAFFSYSRDDSNFVVRVAGDLKAAGANVWLDQLDIAPGQRWDRAIEDALKSCPRLIVILSPTSVASTNVMDEVSFALEEQKAVIPVVYKDCEIPFRLRRLQYVDFKNDYAHGLQELLKVLTPVHAPGPSAPADSDPGRQPRTETLASKAPHPEPSPVLANERPQPLSQQARAEVRRTPAALKESRSTFFSRLPRGIKVAAAVFALLTVAFASWRFLPRPPNKPSGDPSNQAARVGLSNPSPSPPASNESRTQDVRVESANSAAVSSSRKAKNPPNNGPAATAPQPKANGAKSDLRAASGNNVANEAFEQGQSAVRAREFDKALLAFQHAADGGDARAMNGIGDLYVEGNGVPRDYQQAFAWYEKAAAGGNSRAMASLGRLYRDGNGVGKDYQKAREWLEKGVAAGDGRAMAYLGKMYEKGIGVPKDYDHARQLYEQGAAAGDGRAMDNMGRLYAQGNAVPKDSEKAWLWYQKAAAAGDSAGMFDLGWLYFHGLGVAEDKQQARQWYEKAAAAGDAAAMTDLGAMYANGKVVPRDDQKARQLFEKAAAAGNPTAMSNLGILYEDGHGETQDYQQARQWYGKAAARGDSHGMTRLGHLYEAGLGVPKDYQQARQWYEKAAAADDGRAMALLGIMYERGLGVSRDLQQARQWCKKGAAAGDELAAKELSKLSK